MMEKTNENICRLCLKVGEETFSLSVLSREELNVVVPELELTNLAAFDICKKCIHSVEEFYSWKRKYRFTVPKMDNICYMCAGDIGKNETKIQKHTDYLFSSVLDMCLPELSQDNRDKIVSCYSCYNTLRNTYFFKHKCIAAAKKIDLYYKFEPNGDINLRDVLRFMKGASNKLVPFSYLAVENEDDGKSNFRVDEKQSNKRQIDIQETYRRENKRSHEIDNENKNKHSLHEEDMKISNFRVDEKQSNKRQIDIQTTYKRENKRSHEIDNENKNKHSLREEDMKISNFRVDEKQSNERQIDIQETYKRENKRSHEIDNENKKKHSLHEEDMKISNFRVDEKQSNKRQIDVQKTYNRENKRSHEIDNENKEKHSLHEEDEDLDSDQPPNKHMHMHMDIHSKELLQQKKGRAIKEWLDIVEEDKQKNCWTDNFVRKMILIKLIGFGELYEWFIKFTNEMNWEEFKTTVISAFPGESDFATNIRRALTVKKRDNISYCTVYSRKMTFLQKTYVTNKEAVSLIVHGLEDDQVYSSAVAGNNKTTTDLFDYLQQCDDKYGEKYLELSRKARNRFIRDTGRCFTCGSNDHIRKLCPKNNKPKPAGINKQNNKPKPTKNKPAGHFGSNISDTHFSQPSQEICEYCNKVGHLKINCPLILSSVTEEFNPFRKSTEASADERTGENFEINRKLEEKCSFCNTFGHTAHNCNKKLAQFNLLWNSKCEHCSGEHPTLECPLKDKSLSGLFCSQKNTEINEKSPVMYEHWIDQINDNMQRKPTETYSAREQTWSNRESFPLETYSNREPIWPSEAHFLREPVPSEYLHREPVPSEYLLRETFRSESYSDRGPVWAETFSAREPVDSWDQQQFSPTYNSREGLEQLTGTSRCMNCGEFEHCTRDCPLVFPDLSRYDRWDAGLSSYDSESLSRYRY